MVKGSIRSLFFQNLFFPKKRVIMAETWESGIRVPGYRVGELTLGGYPSCMYKIGPSQVGLDDRPSSAVIRTLDTPTYNQPKIGVSAHCSKRIPWLYSAHHAQHYGNRMPGNPPTNRGATIAAGVQTRRPASIKDRTTKHVTTCTLPILIISGKPLRIAGVRVDI